MKKIYYSIGEVCAITGAEHHHIRYWETKVPQLKPKKNRAGNRIFTEEGLALVGKLKSLIIDQKFSIDGAIEHLRKKEETNFKSDFNKNEIINELKSIRLFLNDLKEKL